nr:hypothetical protein [Candidatus Sigynarchaeota archaeon]
MENENGSYAFKLGALSVIGIVQGLLSDGGEDVMQKIENKLDEIESNINARLQESLYGPAGDEKAHAKKE